MSATAIVIDNGSGFIKAGYGGDQHPSTIFPTCIQYPARTPLNVDTDEWKSVCNIGHAANPDPLIPELHRMRYPLDPYGVVQSWDDVERIWRYAFAELGASLPSRHPVIMTEPVVYTPRGQRLEQTALVFETLGAPAYHAACPAVLAAYAANLPIALVVDSGHTASSAVPMYEFVPLRAAARRNEVAGQAVDDFLLRALRTEEGIPFPSRAAAWDFVRLAKFERARVPLDYEVEFMTWMMLGDEDAKTWALPDGKTFSPRRPLGLIAGNVPFYPHILGLDTGGLQHGAFSAVTRADGSLREALFGNILLAGGNTMLPGFGDKLKKEMEGLAGWGTEINVVSPRNRMYSAWMGGSILSQLSTFESMCISRGEYEETGPEIVIRKCL